MIHPLLTILLCCLTLSCSAGSSEADPDKPRDQIVWKGDWFYQCIVLNEGTRSEKWIGKLKFKNKEILGEGKNVLKTPMGLFEWKGYHLTFGGSGWCPIKTINDGQIQAEPSGDYSYWITKPVKK